MYKKVIDEFGREVEIDETTKKLYSYNNKKREIIYNAQIIENGMPSDFWTNYTENGIVDSIEERLKMWNNKILFLYALSVDFNALENDPNKEKYNKLLDFVKENMDKFFTKTGDFRAKFLVDKNEIKALLR